MVFAGKPYVSLENPENRLFAAEDAKGFLAQYPQGAILDEAQRVPELFNYLQQILDETDQNGLFILTGSNNFLLQQNISQSLAGRIGYLELMPLSLPEIYRFENVKPETSELLLKGGYPELYDRNRNPQLWFGAYVRTYVERDIRQLTNIENSLLFTKLLRLCAGRIGQQLNMLALSNECGIELKTVQRWLGILQASYIIYLLHPFHQNYNKRLTKTPKLYFYDTGLAAYLLSIYTVTELASSHFRGALFENAVINEFLKAKHNYGQPTNLYYWRDSNGLEIDLVVETGSAVTPVEIKSAQTFSKDFIKNTEKWNQLSGTTGGRLVYDGHADFKERNGVEILNWKEMVLH